MTPELLAGLRALAAALPPGTAVPVPLGMLLELLDGTTAQAAPSAGALPPADLTVGDLAKRYGRNKATVRGWVEAGRFVGAYRMHGTREWRVPTSGVEAFDTAERSRAKQGAGPKSGTRPRARPVDLSAWRSERSAS